MDQSPEHAPSTQEVAEEITEAYMEQAKQHFIAQLDDPTPRTPVAEMTPAEHATWQKVCEHHRTHAWEHSREKQRLVQMRGDIQRFKRQAQQQFAGSVAEFEQAWPSILQQWKEQKALAANQAPRRIRQVRL